MSGQLSYAIQPNSSFNDRYPVGNLTEQRAAPDLQDEYQQRAALDLQDDSEMFYYLNQDYPDPYPYINDNAPFLVRSDSVYYESKAANIAKQIAQITIMVLGTAAGLLLLMGVLRTKDTRRTPLGLCLSSLSLICILNTLIIGRWSLYSQNASDSPFVYGNYYKFLQMLLLFLRITLPLVLTCLFVIGILTYAFPDRLTRKSSQIILKVALFASHLIPLVFAIVLHQGIKEWDLWPRPSPLFRSTPKRIAEFFYNIFSMVVMAPWPVVLFAFCFKNRGKPCDPVCKSRFTSCCTCAVVFVVLFVFPVCVRNFRWFQYWQISNLLELATPGMMCVLWLLICKDIRQYAFCKKRPEGEHCCEIKINFNCQL